MISWAIFGTIFGALLVWRLGTVAVWAGWVLIGVGVFRAYQLVLSIIHPVGTIVVSDKQVVLPVGLLARDRSRSSPATEVTARLFSAPLGAVESRGASARRRARRPRALLYPRDWFASEADQRHVVHALLSHRTDLVPESAAAGDGASNGTRSPSEMVADGPGYIGTSGREILAGAIFTARRRRLACSPASAARSGHGSESISRHDRREFARAVARAHRPLLTLRTDEAQHDLDVRGLRHQIDRPR